MNHNLHKSVHPIIDVGFHLPKVFIQLLVSTLVSELLFYIWLVVFNMAKTLRSHGHPREIGKILNGWNKETTKISTSVSRLYRVLWVHRICGVRHLDSEIEAASYDEDDVYRFHYAHSQGSHNTRGGATLGPKGVFPPQIFEKKKKKKSRYIKMSYSDQFNNFQGLDMLLPPNDR